jgi:BON domain
MYIMLSNISISAFISVSTLNKPGLAIWARIRALPLALAALACATAAAQPDEQRSNHFGDPFIAITKGLPSCPVPLGPLVTPAQVAEEAHWRSQRGVSCHTAGRCRLPNAYLYDQEIIPRVQLAIDSNGGFTGTSVWAMGQRRWVYLQGCVATRAEAHELERIVRLIDDVESVINELMVGTQGKPTYRTR